MKWWRRRGRAQFFGSTLACGLIAVLGGQALASFTISGINPVYLQQRWGTTAPLVERPEPVAEYTPAGSSFAMAVEPNHLFDLTQPPSAQDPAAPYEKWEEPDLEPLFQEPLELRPPRSLDRLSLDDVNARAPIPTASALDESPLESAGPPTRQGLPSEVASRPEANGAANTPSISESGETSAR